MRDTTSAGSRSASGLRPGFLSVLVLWLAFSAPAASAQQKFPEAHADFRYGASPWSREAFDLLESADTRLLLAAADRGWSLDKFAKETGRSRVQALTLVDRLRDAQLLRGEADYDMRPGLPVLRVAELDALRPALEAHAAAIAGIFETHWNEVEALASSLEAGAEFSRGEILYRIVMGGVLLDGTIQALYDDKTLAPAPPRRSSRGAGYYAWMTEGEAGPAPLAQQSARVGQYEVFSVGAASGEDLRLRLDELAGLGPVYGPDDSRRWRVFASVFSRDHVLPYLKSERSRLLQLYGGVRASRYTAFAEFVAWYYQELAVRVGDALAAEGRIVPPAESFKYALRVGR